MPRFEVFVPAAPPKLPIDLTLRIDAEHWLAALKTGLQRLGVAEVVCAPLPLSHGLTRGSHGALPLPAPATLELLRGAPVRAAGSDRELVTPTGAAIASTSAAMAASRHFCTAR